MSSPGDEAPRSTAGDQGESYLDARRNGPVIVSYAQNAEDVRLWRVLGARSDGFYVDVGAADPVRYSVTKLFYDAGWSGINVEPGPRYESLRAARPRDVNLPIAISSQAGSARMWVSSRDPDYSSLNKLEDERLAQDLELTGQTVRTARVDAVLAEHALGRRIDFMKIDVEGAEHEVLSSFDLRAIRPSVLVVEAISPFDNRPNHEQWEQQVLDADYLFAVFDGINRFYVPTETAYLIPALEYPLTVLDRYVLHESAATLSGGDGDDETLDGFTTLWRQGDISRLEAASRDATERLTAIEKTVSWRVTRPLRAVRGIQRRLRGGPDLSADAESREASYEAFAARLAQVSDLLAPVPAEKRCDVRSIDRAIDSFADAVSASSATPDATAWLALLTVDGSYPGPDEVDSASRLLRSAGPRALGEALRGRALDSEFPTTVLLDIVRDATIVDASMIVTSDLHTGIQRVARELTSRWIQEQQPLHIAYFDDHAGALKLVSAEEVERLRRWHEHLGGSGASVAARRPEEVSGNPLVPWNCRLIFPELLLERRQSRALGALGTTRVHRSLSFVCFDLIPIVAAETLDPALAGAFCNHLSVVKRADHISAISRQSADDYLAFTSMLAAEGVRGPEVRAHPLPTVAPSLIDSDVDSARAALDFGAGPIVLVVGVHVPRKNHTAVLEAAEKLWKRGLEFELLFIGGYDRSSAEEFDRYVRRLEAAGWPVRVKRRASEAELWAAYKAARFTVYPSLLEGFGLPVAESLASGTPVITSPYGCLAEIAAGGGAVLADPRNVEDLAEQMRRLLENDELVERLRSEARARDFGSWDDYAREVWRFFVDDAD